MKVFLALLLAAIGVSGSIYLLYDAKINQFVFLGCIGTIALTSLAVYFSDRLKELDIKGFKIVLNQIQTAVSEAQEERQRIEKSKDELAEMYGEVRKLRREPFVMDGEKTSKLGIGSGPVINGGTIMRYVSGVVTRERERLAKTFVNPKDPEALARAILDGSHDDNVFKWIGPGSRLEDPPKTATQRNLGKVQQKLKEPDA